MLKKLFDFDTFYFPKMVRVFFGIIVVFIALSTLVGFFGGLSDMGRGFLQGLGKAIFALLMGAIGIIVARISTELTLVFFSINDHLKAIRDKPSGS